MEFGFVLPGCISMSWLQKSRVDQKFLTSSKGNQQSDQWLLFLQGIKQFEVMTWFWLDIDWPATLNHGCIIQHSRQTFVLFFIVIWQSHGYKKAGLTKNFYLPAKFIYWGTSSFYLFKALNKLEVMTWSWLDIDWQVTLNLFCMIQHWRWNFVLAFLVVCQNHGCKKAGPPKNSHCQQWAIHEGPVAFISSWHWTTCEWSHGFSWILISKPHWCFDA